MPKSNLFDVQEWHRQLRSIKRQLLRQYRENKPKNPSEMSTREVGEEWDLMRQIAGTTYMTPFMQKRWKKLDYEYSSNCLTALCSSF